MDANKVKSLERWESVDDSYVIYEDYDGAFIAAQIDSDGRGGWYYGMNSCHDLWFQSYAQARKHLKDESCVDSRFKKVKGDDQI